MANPGSTSPTGPFASSVTPTASPGQTRKPRPPSSCPSQTSAKAAVRANTSGASGVAAWARMTCWTHDASASPASSPVIAPNIRRPSS